MALTIDLLGPPRATRDGHLVAGIRGAKAWFLLAYLLRAEGPVERRRIASLLFPDAADPAGALRWNLSQLRRLLGVELDGDPLAITLPADTCVDLEILARGEAADAAIVAGRGSELLEGLRSGDDGDLAIWLEGERRHIAALTVDVLREAAVAHLARGEAAAAADLAERVVHLDPLDENAAVLLVRSLREAGRGTEARSVAERTAARLRQTLGVEPTSALWSAVHTSSGGAARFGGRTAIEAQLDAGEAALAAGVPDAGIDALRTALGGSRALGHDDLLARCLCALASALIHAVRGTDQDGLTLLHEAVPAALSAQLPALAARASRELGYVDLLRGRYERAVRWFVRAREHAGSDDEELAWIDAFSGVARTDVADHAGASELLDDAVGRATSIGAERAVAMALAWRGRLRLLTDGDAAATDDLDRSIAITGRIGWRSLQPLPQTMRAEIALRHGELEDALTILHPALATSRQVGDPCWEAMALRGLGLVTVARGDLAAGLELLEAAPQQCRRLPDTYLWVEAYGMDALADVTSERGLPAACAWIEALEELTTSHDMRALSASAVRYRRRLTERGDQPIFEVR